MLGQSLMPVPVADLGVPIDGAELGAADLPIHVRERQHIDSVDHLRHSFDTLDDVFRIGLEHGIGDVAHQCDGGAFNTKCEVVKDRVVGQHH